MQVRLPERYDLACYKGQSFSQPLEFKQKTIDPQTGKEVLVTYPLTGYTAKAEIRPSENSPVLIAEMVVNVTEVDGLVSLALTADMTASMKPGIHYWDMYTIKPNGKRQYWAKGKFMVIGRVTE